MLFRFRTVDRLPETSSPDAVRGTLIHRVLEDIFDLPARERTPAAAAEALEPTWRGLCEQDPTLAEVVGSGETEQAWLDSAQEVMARWFDLEDPTRLEPAERETRLEHLLDSGLLLRGIVDRIDIAPDGALRVVDYKTGKAPAAGFEARALFQLRFYALMIWRSRGVIPRLLQLIYLGNAVIVSYEPDEADLLAAERKIDALWAAIRLARETGDYQPSPGKICDWCSHQALCPAFGGTPPPLPIEPEAPSTRRWWHRLRGLLRRD